MADNIITAFDELLAALEEHRDTISHQIAQHAATQQFDKVVALGTQGNTVDEMRSHIAKLRTQWQTTLAQGQTQTPRNKPTVAAKFTVPERGIRTPQNTYYRPILEALIELGGRAEPKDVLPRVYNKLKHILTAHDREQLPSDPNKIRWDTAARFASHELRVQGLLAKSRNGIWEISAAGRRYIEETSG
jgi:restriction system protein